MNGSNGNMQIKTWVAIVVPIITLLVGMGISYGVIQSAVDRNTQDIYDLNHNVVPDFREELKEISKTLSRIEGKLESINKEQ